MLLADPSIRTGRLRFRAAGGYDFENAGEAVPPRQIIWTARALPAAIWIQNAPPEAGDPCHQLPAAQLAILDNGATRGFVIAGAEHSVRTEVASDTVHMPAALLPLDRLFELRVQSALRLWRALSGHDPGPDPVSLSPARRDRLLLALRALDGWTAKASYRDIASTLYGRRAVPERGWKTHDLRDRTIRLVRTGRDLMQGGYRSLLLFPYRSRSRATTSNKRLTRPVRT